MAIWITAPALLPMLRHVAIIAERHQVGVIQRDPWVVDVLRRNRLLMVYLGRRFDQSILPARLTQPAF